MTAPFSFSVPETIDFTSPGSGRYYVSQTDAGWSQVLMDGATAIRKAQQVLRDSFRKAVTPDGVWGPKSNEAAIEVLTREPLGAPMVGSVLADFLRQARPGRPIPVEAWSAILFLANLTTPTQISLARSSQHLQLGNPGQRMPRIVTPTMSGGAAPRPPTPRPPAGPPGPAVPPGTPPAPGLPPQTPGDPADQLPVEGSTSSLVLGMTKKQWAILGGVTAVALVGVGVAVWLGKPGASGGSAPKALPARRPGPVPARMPARALAGSSAGRSAIVQRR